MPRQSANPRVGITWQEVALPFSSGVDLRSNDRARPTARLARLINGGFAERNTLTKRAGHRGGRVMRGDVYGTPFDTSAQVNQDWIYGLGLYDTATGISGGLLSPGQETRLGTVITRQDQLAVWTGDRLLSRDEGFDRWYGQDVWWDDDVGSDPPDNIGVAMFAPSAKITDVPDRPGEDTIAHQSAVGRKYVLSTRLDQTADEVTVNVESTDGTVVLPSRVISTGEDSEGNPVVIANITRLRAMWLDEHLVVLIGNDTNVYSAHAPENDVSTWLIEQINGVDLETSDWDAVKVSDDLALFIGRTATDIRITYFKPYGPVQAPAEADTILDLDGQVADGLVAIAVAPNGTMGVLFEASDTRCAVYTPAGGLIDQDQFHASAPVRLTVASKFINAGGVVETFVGFVEIAATGVYVGEFGRSGASATYNRLRYNVGIAGRAFAVGNEVFCTMTTDQSVSNLQITYALVGGVRLPRLAGVWSRSTAINGGLQPIAPPPTSADFLPDQDPFNRTRWVLSFTHTPAAVPGLFGARRGLRVELDFLPSLQWAEAGRSVYFSGAVVNQWDGGPKTHEAGFIQYPEHPTAPNHDVGGGSVGDGTYRYRVYYARRNRFGEVSRSPALTSSEVVAAGGPGKITLTLKTLQTTSDPDVYFEIYRNLGEVSGSVYHIVSGHNVTIAVRNSFTAATVTFEDTSSDASIAGRPTDPHNPVPGFPVELEEVALPGCEVLARVGDRLWFAGGEVARGQLAYSKFFEPGETVGWNDLGVLVYTLDSRSAPITSVGDISGAVAAFRRDEVFVIGGDGPDNLGNGSFAISRRIKTDLGATDHRATVAYPDGLAYWSDQGPRVLTEQLTSVILGDEVTPAAAASSPVQGVLVPAQSQLRWYLEDGSALVYDYVTRQWAVHTGLDAVSAVHWPVTRGAVVARANGEVLFEDPTVRTDLGQPYVFAIRTAELRPEDLLQGAHRARRWGVTGQWKGTHALTASVRYDGSEYVDERKTWTIAGDIDNLGWGTGLTAAFGTTGDTVWPSSTARSQDGVYRTRRRLRRQRFSSVSFEFSDGGAPGDSFVIVELALELGRMDGLTRLPRRSFV